MGWDKKVPKGALDKRSVGKRKADEIKAKRQAKFEATQDAKAARKRAERKAKGKRDPFWYNF
jgi:hypothetical protein